MNILLSPFFLFLFFLLQNNGAFTDDRAAREAAVGEVDGSDESESEEDNEQEGRRSRRTRRLVVRV